MSFLIDCNHLNDRRNAKGICYKTVLAKWCYDILQNNFQYNGTQHNALFAKLKINDTWHKWHSAQLHSAYFEVLSTVMLCHNYSNVMLSVVMLSVIMLSAVMLSVIMLSTIMLSAIMLSVIMLSVIMLSVILQSVVMLSVVMI